VLTGPLLGKGYWRAIPEPGVPPLPVIEDLDALRDLAPSQIGFLTSKLQGFPLRLKAV
jgi:hypothetical protein